MDKPIKRTTLVSAYVRNMTDYIKTLHPEASDKDIEVFVKSQIKDEYNILKNNSEKAMRGEEYSGKVIPTCQLVRNIDQYGNFSYGNKQYEESADLLQYIGTVGDKILSPSGTAYETTDKKSSYLKKLLDGLNAERKAEKKAYFTAKKNGDDKTAAMHYNNQTSIKITTNSIPGGMGFSHSFISDAPNFASITSIGRSVVQNSFAHAERLLEGNFYFPNTEWVIDFCTTCKLYGPKSEDVVRVCQSKGIHLPEPKEVFDFLVDNLRKYQYNTDGYDILKKLLTSYESGTLAFIFYMSNLKNLFQTNDGAFRPWIDKIFSDKEVDFTQECKVEDIWSLDEDLITMLCTVRARDLPTNKNGNTFTIQDCIEQGHGELVKRLYLIGKHMQDTLDEMKEVLTMFTDHGVGIRYTNHHYQMFRKTVGNSDTDSILFTTRSWCEWYLGYRRITEDSYHINSLIVYLLSKANERILYHLSVVLGALNDERKIIAMKNEFMMPVQIMTSLKKHYVSISKMQEGIQFGTPLLDIKGVGLRGSQLGKLTLKYAEWFISYILDQVLVNDSLDAQELILAVLKFERMILDSVRSGDTEFMTVEPIRREDEYKEADKSIFFNYRLWESVYGDKYGNIDIPTKCYTVPLVKNKIKSATYLAYLESVDKGMCDRLVKFTNKYPKKDISRIPIHPDLERIPEVLTDLVDVRKIIYSNTQPMYLILQSLGINAGKDGAYSPILSDIYGFVSSERGHEAKALLDTL